MGTYVIYFVHFINRDHINVLDIDIALCFFKSQLNLKSITLPFLGLLWQRGKPSIISSDILNFTFIFSITKIYTLIFFNNINILKVTCRLVKKSFWKLNKKEKLIFKSISFTLKVYVSPLNWDHFCSFNLIGN